MDIKNKLTRIAGATLLALPALVGTVANAQTTAPTTTATPGVPTTGLGGDMFTNILVLAVAAFVIIAAIAYMYTPDKTAV